MTDPPPGAATPVTERIRRIRTTFAPAEERVVQTLLVDYPMAGLGSVARLAEAAGVSAPTVLRLLAKLGFSGYPEFRDQLHEEVAARLFTPLAAYPSGRHDELAAAEVAFTESVRETFRGVDAVEFEAAVSALADTGRDVVAAGGRFSATTAAQLAHYLELLRPGVTDVAPEPGRRARALLSIGPTTTVVVFDFRRYQADTVAFGLQAKARGAALVLVCDPYLSPLAPQADVVLTASMSGPPPFDSAVGGFMLVEALVAAVARRLGDTARARLADFEENANGADPGVLAALSLPRP